MIIVAKSIIGATVGMAVGYGLHLVSRSIGST
jgi:hypothetical protein